MSAPVLLRPEVAFAAIHRAFSDAGWRGGPTVLTAPLVAGEPELATWRRGDTLVRYDCNPVVWLRVLRVVRGDALLPELPALTPDDVLALLRGPNGSDAQGGEVLLGVLAATELRLPDARPLLRALAAGPPAAMVTRFARLALD